jgi:Ca2+-binding RTX toxin-like protein
MATYIVNATRDSYQEDPEVALLRNGRAVTIWDDLENDPDFSGGYGVYLTLTSTDFSTAYSREIRGHQRTDGAQQGPEISALADGGFVIGYDGDGPGARDGVEDPYDDAYLRFFDADGRARTDELQITPTRTGDNVVEDVATLTDGSVLAMVGRRYFGGTYDLVATRYSAEGDYIGARVLDRDVDSLVTLFGADRTPGVRIAPTRDGGYGLVWYAFEDTAPGYDGFRVFAQTFSADGGATAPRQTVSIDANGLDHEHPEITALSTGGFAVAWERAMDEDDVGEIDVFVRLLDEDGRPSGRQTLVNVGDRAGEQRMGDVVDLGAGVSLVTFFSERAGESWQSMAALRGRIFGPDGRALTSVFDVSEFAMDGMTGGNSVLAPDGRLTSVWTAEETYDFNEDILGVSTELPRLVWRGGRSADEITGADIRDDIRGGAGSDVLRGARGDDLLNGDDGWDLLSGGDGRDLLYGGENGDRLYGGDGDDRLSGGGGADLMSGGQGRDRLYGGANDDELLGGGGNDLLAGGPGDDRLTGGSGADVFVLRARWGTDVVTDFGGSDRIDLSGAGFRGFAAVEAAAVNRRGSTVIEDDDGSVLRIADVRPTELEASDFLF